MTRYQINIGDEFPVEPEREFRGPRHFGRFRHPPYGVVGALVRALFAVSLVVLAVTHALVTAIGLGAVLVIGRFKGTCGGYGRWRDHDRGRHGWHAGFRRGGFERGSYDQGAFV